MPLPTTEQPPRRVPPRCRMLHPYVAEAAALRLAAHAALLGVHPDQLAGHIIEQVLGDVGLYRRIGI